MGLTVGVGRKRVPDNLHILRGTYKPNRHGPRDKQPLLPAKAPRPPEWMSVSAKAEWRRVAKLLEPAGVLTEGDRGLLTAYCVLWERVKTMAENRTADPPTLAQFRLCCSELGLTPSSRAKMSVPNAPKENPFAALADSKPAGARVR